MFDLEGKVAVVTGGNGGIGLAIARGLSAAGARVVVWGRNPDKNEAAVSELAASGAEAWGVECDVSDERAVEEAFAASVDRFSKVDAVIANAGVRQGSVRFAEMDLSEWRRVMEVNLDGAFLTFRTAVRHLLERGASGSLVATSSIASRFGTPRGEHYAGSKAALNAMVRGLAVEYGRYGIRANAVMPGWVETEMTAEAFSRERFREAVLPRIPAGRWGRPEDLAGIAVYLISDASRWHTGDVITVDGGYSVF